MSTICKTNFIGLLLILSCVFGYSQVPNRFLLECKSEILKPGKNPSKLKFSFIPSRMVIMSNSFLNIQTGKKPMFCRMEDNLHKRFNVWIVMRAGSDEEYKKLIEEKEKPSHEDTP